MPMRMLMTTLLALVLVACRPAATNSTASSAGHSTLEEITKAVQNACNVHDADALTAMSQTQGQPPELTAAVRPMLNAMLNNTNLKAGEVKSVEFAKYEPDQELPGEFNDKPLEYLVPPSHWILVEMASPEGQQPKIKLKLTLPTAQVDGKWVLAGARYKK